MSGVMLLVAVSVVLCPMNVTQKCKNNYNFACNFIGTTQMRNSMFNMVSFTIY